MLHLVLSKQMSDNNMRQNNIIMYLSAAKEGAETIKNWSPNWLSHINFQLSAHMLRRLILTLMRIEVIIDSVLVIPFGWD